MMWRADVLVVLVAALGVVAFGVIAFLVGEASHTHTFDCSWRPALRKMLEGGHKK